MLTWYDIGLNSKLSKTQQSSVICMAELDLTSIIMISLINEKNRNSDMHLVKERCIGNILLRTDVRIWDLSCNSWSCWRLDFYKPNVQTPPWLAVGRAFYICPPPVILAGIELLTYCMQSGCLTARLQLDSGIVSCWRRLCFGRKVNVVIVHEWMWESGKRFHNQSL